MHHFHGWLLFTGFCLLPLLCVHCFVGSTSGIVQVPPEVRNNWPISRRVGLKGDIGVMSMLRRQNMNRKRRNGVRMDKHKWIDGIIPYEISDQYTFADREVFDTAIKAYHEETCLRFVPRTAMHTDYLYIAKIDGCYSDVGRIGGQQVLSLGDGCNERATVMHEMMHAVGFWHEHERPDRDKFIDIRWENIERSAFDQFGTVSQLESYSYGEDYDYLSLLHYDSHAFSRNGGITIAARDPEFTPVIGTMKYFSPTDIRKINKMYRCPWRYFGVRLPTPAASVQPLRGQIPSDPSYFNKQPFIDWSCKDLAVNCRLFINYCRSYFLRYMMEINCRRTCEFCQACTTTPDVTLILNTVIAVTAVFADRIY